MSFICMRVKSDCYNNGFAHSLALKRSLGNSEMAYLTQLVPRLTRIFKPTIYSNISFDESASLSSANATGA